MDGWGSMGSVKLKNGYELTKSTVSVAEKYFIVFMLASIHPLVDNPR